MCPSGATCLPADCCFSKLALQKSNSSCRSRTKRTSSSFHWKLTCSRHVIAENCCIGVKQHSSTDRPTDRLTDWLNIHTTHEVFVDVGFNKEMFFLNQEAETYVIISTSWSGRHNWHFYHHTGCRHAFNGNWWITIWLSVFWESGRYLCHTLDRRC